MWPTTERKSRREIIFAALAPSQNLASSPGDAGGDHASGPSNDGPEGLLEHGVETLLESIADHGSELEVIISGDDVPFELRMSATIKGERWLVKICREDEPAAMDA
jgi:hypothetical protein